MAVTSKLGLAAKKTLQEYVRLIDERLSDYWDSEVVLNFGFNQRQRKVVKEMLLHSKEHNLRPSKRLRASFVSYGYLLGEKNLTPALSLVRRGGESIWKAAMGVELVHTALLIHDDFMDRDDVRRGGPTTHKYFEKKYKADKHYGESMAVSVGDAVLCVGFQLLLECDFPVPVTVAAMKQMLRGIANTAYGQAYDVTLETMKNWTEDDVISLHRAKTAIYTYENPLLIGMALTGATDEKAKKILSDYSMDGGVAFQLQDDILGVFGNEEDTGKSADSDLKQGKCTLLILKVLEMGSEKQKKAVERVWGSSGASRADLDLAKRAIEESGSLVYSRKLAKKLAGRAAETANKLRKFNLNSEAIDYLVGIAEYMVEREV